MNLTEYAATDGVGLAELVREGAVTPAELASLALRAADATNPELNAILEMRPVLAVDTALDRGASPPFDGVPFLLKDLGCHTSGRFEACSRLSAGNTVDHDSELAVRFRRAGLVILGRTTTPELGYNATTESVFAGPTRNPWDPSRSPGGSSGGSAAAVAAGIVPVAHANDGGGSIRIPAACCGVVGLKPTRGRNSLGPDFDEALCGLACEHVVSRTLRDTAVMLDATSGPAPGDPYYPPPPAQPFALEIGADPGRLRIALNLEPWTGDSVEPEVRAQIERAAELCEALGHDVEPASFSFDYESFLLANLRIWTTFLVLLVDELARSSGRKPCSETLEEGTLVSYEYGRHVTGRDLLEARLVVNAVSRSAGAFFARHDVMLSPTTITSAPKLGILDQNRAGLTAVAWLDQIFRFAPFPAIFNATGQPALVLPWALGADGLPIGVHFAGRYADEATLFRLGSQFEAASPGIGIPPLHVASSRE